jgi:hypothetical protein
MRPGTTGGGFVETDIASCFEAIPHDGLMCGVEERIGDQKALNLVRGMLRAGVMEHGSVRGPVPARSAHRWQSSSVRTLTSTPTFWPRVSWNQAAGAGHRCERDSWISGGWSRFAAGVRRRTSCRRRQRSLVEVEALGETVAQEGVTHLGRRVAGFDDAEQGAVTVGVERDGHPQLERRTSAAVLGVNRLVYTRRCGGSTTSNVPSSWYASSSVGPQRTTNRPPTRRSV